MKDADYLDHLSALTPEQKFTAASELFDLAQRLFVERLRAKNPSMTDEQIDRYLFLATFFNHLQCPSHREALEKGLVSV